MKVSELAKEFKVTNKDVLNVLRSLKLKAKDGNQDMNKVVVDVVSRALKKELKGGGKEKATAKVAKPQEAKKESKKAVLEKKTAGKKVSSKKEGSSPKVTPAKQAKKAPKEKARKEDKKKTTTGKAKASATKKTPEKLPEKKKPVKPKKKISDAPFIPLKPLAKKKRRPTGKEREGMSLLAPKGEEAVGGGQPLESKRDGSLVPGTKVSPEDLKPLEVKVPISIKDFAVKVQQKTSVILMNLMRIGIIANINQNLGEDIVRRLAEDFGFHLTEVKTREQQLLDTHKQEEDDPQLMTQRAPVVTLMGHVDHGKTSLLDRIRSSRITDQEHGGITQHIGAYSVTLDKGTITFLDTPGHEAFTAMRARGAHITDIVVLVVAADEGIMPQTEEAIDHARAADVPIVVALNKIDRRNADPDRVKKELAQHGLNPEEWNGNTIVIGVSAVTGEGVDKLLEMILLEAEMLELKANSKKKASGIVVEAHLSGGKGAVASLIVQSGTLRLNDVIVVGPYYGKIKALFDYRERPIIEAGPSTPVEIMGLPGVPEAGEMFYAVEDEKQAKEISSYRQQLLKDEKLRSSQKLTLEDLYSRIKEGSIKELNVILKADVKGSLEALKDSLEKIPSDEVKVKFIHTGVGDVNASDVILAVASNAIIIAFHVGVGPKASEELIKQPVDVRQYRIIYDAVNDVRNALEGLLEPKKLKKFLSRIEVRQVFKLSKSGIVAGCFVVKGKVNRKAKIDVIRNGETAHSGTISSLKRFKDDVREVSEGYECGISLQGYDKIQPGDILEAYEVETIARTL